jgi:hypothetical protein
MSDQQILTQSASLSNATANIIQSNNNNNNNINNQQINSSQSGVTSSSNSNTRKPCNCTKSMCLKLYLFLLYD